MADYNSSLPVRTENAGDVISKIADATIPSQQLTVEADGSINVNTNFDPAAVVRVSNFPTTVDTNYGTVGANTIRTAAQIGNATGAADFNAGATGAQTLRVDANQGEPNAVADAWPVRLTDGVDTVAVNANGSLNVVVIDSTPFTEVNDYNTVAAVAAGATSTHTYTSTGNFNLTQIEASGSGKMKIEVQVNAVTKFVQFNSTATPNMGILLSQPIVATVGQTVTVIRTNKDNQAQDVYSTISGFIA